MKILEITRVNIRGNKSWSMTIEKDRNQRVLIPIMEETFIQLNIEFQHKVLRNENRTIEGGQLLKIHFNTFEL